MGIGGGSGGCAAAGRHLPRDSFSSAIACLLSKSPTNHNGSTESKPQIHQQLHAICTDCYQGFVLAGPSVIVVCT